MHGNIKMAVAHANKDQIATLQPLLGLHYCAWVPCLTREVLGVLHGDTAPALMMLDSDSFHTLQAGAADKD